MRIKGKDGKTINKKLVSIRKKLNDLGCCATCGMVIENKSSITNYRLGNLKEMLCISCKDKSNRVAQEKKKEILSSGDKCHHCYCKLTEEQLLIRNICDKCYDLSKTRVKNHYAEKRKTGKCIRCPNPVSKGMIVCYECRLNTLDYEMYKILIGSGKFKSSIRGRKPTAKSNNSISLRKIVTTKQYRPSPMRDYFKSHLDVKRTRGRTKLVPIVQSGRDPNTVPFIQKAAAKKLIDRVIKILQEEGYDIKS